MFLWLKHKLDGETRHRCNTIKKTLVNFLLCSSCFVACFSYVTATWKLSQPAFRGVNHEARAPVAQCLEATLGLARASNKLRTISTLLGLPRLNATAESNGVIPKPRSGGLGSQRRSKSFCKVSRLAIPATSVSDFIMGKIHGKNLPKCWYMFSFRPNCWYLFKVMKSCCLSRLFIVPYTVV